MENIKSKIAYKINEEINTASRFISLYPDQIDYFSSKIEALNRVREWLKDVEENVVENLKAKLTIELGNVIKEGEVQALEDLREWLKGMEV